MTMPRIAPAEWYGIQARAALFDELLACLEECATLVSLTSRLNHDPALERCAAALRRAVRLGRMLPPLKNQETP